MPTAERDSTIGLSIFKSIFRSVRGLMYNSPEERAMIQAIAGNQDVPGVVVGVGSEVPANPQPARFRQKFDIRGPFAVYVGRIDENKGCKELFDFFSAYLQEAAGRLTLVLIGNSLLEIPQHPRIRHLGFLDDVDKFDAIAGVRTADHAVVLREPVDGRARSVGARKTGARQREVRRAEGPVHQEQRRAVLRQPSPNSSKRCARSNTTMGGRQPRQERPAVLPRLLRLAGDRAEVSRHDRSAVEVGSRRRPIEPHARVVRAPEGRLPGRLRGRGGAFRPGRRLRRKRTCRARRHRSRRRCRDAPRAPDDRGPFQRDRRHHGAGATAAGLTPAVRGERRRHVRPFTRCSRRWATAMRSATRCSASSECCASAGYCSDIFVETVDPRLESLTRDYRELVDASAPDNLLLHHFSIGSKASRTAYALPDRMALIYHNITPPEYFAAVHRTLARQCFRGRREIHAYIDRCDLALGDSEFNRQDLESLGFPRTAVLPVVPDLAHLDDPADWFVARQFDDDWTNILFVGRVIGNKKIEDLIRFFHAYQTSSIRAAGC